MTTQKPTPPKSLAETIREREDDARELAKRAAAETVAQKVQRYLSKKMTGDDMKRFYGTNQKDIEAEEVRREEAPSKHATAIWFGGKSAENYHAEQAEWMRCHPQVAESRDDAGDVENLYAIADWLREKNLDPSAQHIDSAFVSLAMEGRLVLNPSACGAGPETEVTGDALRRHPNLWKILEPFHVRNKDPEQEKINRMSADQFKASRPELQEQGVPALVLQGIGRVFDTFCANHAEYRHTDANAQKLMAALKNRGPISVQLIEEVYSTLRGELELNDSIAQHGQTTITTYPRESRTPIVQHQHVEIADRVKKFTPQQIARMTAQEFEEWSKNPDFIEQVDRMER